MTGSEAITKEGVSILTAVRNRESSLLQALPSWLASAANEILILDYSSDKPVIEVLNTEAVDDPRIRIIRVEGKPRWWLADAFNSGLKHVAFDRVLKLDADHKIAKEIIRDANPNENQFFTGHWSNPLPGQAHTNGAVFVATKHLRAVGGWDPRIRTYGWDDSDLYERLIYFGLTRKLIRPELLTHITHSDTERLENQDRNMFDSRSLLRALTEANRIASQKSIPWRGDSISHSDPGSLRQKLDPAPIVSSDIERTLMSITTIGKILSSNSRSWESFRSNVPQIIKRLLVVLMPRTESLERNAPKEQKNQRELLVRVEAGLGNRLRALAAGFQYAQRKGTKLVVAWIPDAHCEAELADLFDWGGDVVTSEQELEERISRKSHVAFDWRVKMSVFQVLYSKITRKHLYVRSSKFFLMGTPSSWTIAERFLKSLSPSGGVRALIGQVQTDYPVAFHVRQVGGAKFEHLEFEAEHNWGKAAQRKIGLKRASVKTEIFEFVVDYLLSCSPGPRGIPVFVAADNQETKDRLVAALGPSARYLPSSPEGRGLHQIQEAFAEMILISEADLLIGSTYSSFTEVAHILASDKQVLKQVGDRFF
jgi:hypothetical protein